MASWRCSPLAKFSLSLLLGTLVALTCPHATWAQESTHSSGWVVISVDEYRSLRERAFPTATVPQPPPIAATLTRVDYDLQVNNETASGRATVTVDVLKDGWVRVPIPQGLLVKQAHLDGKLLSLVPNSSSKAGDGHLAALLAHPGRAVLQLDIAVPINATTGSESISLPATASGVTRASLQVPRRGMDIRLDGGLLTEKSESSSGSHWIAYARGTEPLAFTWRTRTQDHRTTLPLRMRGSLTELISMGEDSTTLSAEAAIDVTQGQAQQIKVLLPAAVTVNQVSGAAVADWEVKSGELTVTFLEPVEKSSRFVISGETQVAREAQIDIPLLRLLGVERESGGVAVEVLGAGEIKEVKSQGLEEADATDLGEMIASRQSQALSAFRFRIGDPTSRTLSVNVARYTQQAVLMANVEEARYRVLISGDGKTLVQARYAVRNNQRNFVKITLPPGAVVWSAALADKPVKPGQAPDGSLLLPLQRARGGEDAPEFVVEMTYFNRGSAWSDKGDLSILLPVLDLPISRTGLQIYHPPLFRLNFEPGSFRAEAYVNPIAGVLNAPTVAEFAATSPVSVGGPQSAQDRKDQVAQTLVDKYRAKSIGGRSGGILPIRVPFPACGPSIFLVSELTSAGEAPKALFTYQRDKKAGVQ